MNEKNNRQSAIQKVIKSETISSQEEILYRLKEQGFNLTQATLSRDLKAMKIIKVHQGNAYKYIVASEASIHLPIAKGINFMADGFKSIEFSGNIAVVKTLPAYAGSIAAIIDSARTKEILGTVAGDDTIFIIMRNNVNQQQLKDALINIMPLLSKKMI